MTDHVSRQPAGSPDGGQFAPSAGGAEADSGALGTTSNTALRSDPDIARVVEQMVNLSERQTASLEERDRHLMNDPQLMDAENRAHVAIVNSVHDGLDADALYSQYRAAVDEGSANWRTTEGLVVANAALLALHARATGKLSGQDWETMTRPWAVIVGPIDPYERNIGAVDKMNIDDLNLPAHLRSQAAIDEFEHRWASKDELGERSIKNRIDQVQHILDTGTWFNKPITDGMRGEFEGIRRDLLEGLATRGRSLHSVQDSVTDVVVYGDPKHGSPLNVDPAWTD